MWPFKKKEQPNDILILINDQEIRELLVDGETEEAVYSGELSLPKADAQVRYFPSGGRAFIYGYDDAEYMCKAENIARLEKSVVLQNLFDYGHTEKKANIQFYVMMAVLIITIFLLR